MQFPPETRPALGILPIGSGNDFVRGALRTNYRTNVLDTLLGSKNLKSVDIAYVTVNGGARRYVCNVVGIGFDAAVTMHSIKMKRLQGRAMYMAAVFRTLVNDFDSPEMEIAMDSRPVITQRVMMLTVGNGTREGGGFITTPDARIDDGHLDYAMIGPVSRKMILRLIPEVMRGTHGRFKQVNTGTLKLAHVRAQKPVLVHADGEMLSTYADNVREVEIGVVAGGIRIVTE
jgi:diacylglycerol kinase family enzyme